METRRGSAGGQVQAVRQKEAALARYFARPNLCTTCGQVIVPRPNQTMQEVRLKKFCTRSCAASYNNTTHPKRHKSTTAKPRNPLGRHVPRPRPSTLGTRTKGALFATRAHYQSARSAIQRDAHLRFKATGQPLVCGQCGYGHYAEVCHRRSVSSFPADAPLSEINDPSNLIALCPNCHWEFDHGLWSL